MDRQAFVLIIDASCDKIIDSINKVGIFINKKILNSNIAFSDKYKTIRTPVSLDNNTEFQEFSE